MYQTPDHPIIDVHAHWGPWFFAMDIGPVEENLRLMDLYGITIQLVSATEGVVYDAVGANAKFAAILADQPRLRGYLVVNPNDVAAGEADLRRHLPSPLWAGVKIHTGYPGRPISSPQMRDTFAMLDDFGVTILIHTWGPEIFALAELLQANPNVRAVAGHMAGDRWDYAVQAAAECDRLYLEPSCSVTDSVRVPYVVQHAPRRQLLFGSDATLIDPAVAIGQLEDAHLDAVASEQIYWRNAANLFGLHDAVADVRRG